MTNDVKRRRAGRPTARDLQSAATRDRVVAAARLLFEERGYTRTTVNEIAEAAQVSPETVYKSLGGKSGLLDAIIDAAISGPAGVPYEEQQQWQEVVGLPTPQERLRRYVHLTCSVLKRTRPVHSIIRSAATTEVRAADVRARQLRIRLTRNTQHLNDYIGSDLRPGLTLKDAAEQYCALSSPELYELFTVQLGWTERRYEQWLAATAEREFLAGR